MSRPHQLVTMTLLIPLLCIGCEEPLEATPAGSTPTASTPSGPQLPSTPPVPDRTAPPASTPDSVPRYNPDPYPVNSAMGMGNRAFSLLLAEVVTKDGLVRYDLLESDSGAGRLALTVKKYAEAALPKDPKALIAYYCNVYNANLLFHAVMEQARPGFTNVLDVDGLFDTRPILVAGEPMPLNYLENDRVRPLGDPRIHAALVCGAMSCPPLRDEAYVPGIIDEQLDDQCRRWVNNPRLNRVEDGVLRISEIFNWYGEDFDVEPYGGVVGFIRHFAAPGGALADFLRDNPEPTIEWLPYDWSLNRATK